ncbi:MAG: SDR family oxidoreductase [Proteobacteria bacterium]|nr:SDR family oxidoreductase [Pseudomonadota bacterium]MBU1581750.1 SDR family oxidoreductase [Pseudomonadota bacterium]MBU2628678.1 SDR family oxidoreductase [Pseudomonadota bacterium]
MEIQEPEIKSYEILIIKDENFIPDNVCIVTGAGSGIGRAAAIAAAKNQLTVVGFDINEGEAKKTCEMVASHGGKMECIQIDLCDSDAVAEAVEKAASFGQIKYLANIAGLQHIDSVENFPMEKYDLMQKLMLRAPFLLSKLVIPHMKKSKDQIGVIANMSSVHGHICTKNKPVYNITKFGLRGLSQSVSAEGEGKIRSFTISTGFVRTRLALNQIAAQAEQRGITPDEVVEKVMMGNSRVKEMMTPIEVGNMIIFGFSRHANYLIGGDLLFDGGMVLTY